MDWSYVAGLFDGEGSAYLAKITSGSGSKSVYLTIYITNSSEILLKKLWDFLSGQGYHCYIKRTDKKYNSVTASSKKYSVAPQLGMLRWNECERFIDSILPHVIEKRNILSVCKKVIELRKTLLEQKELLKYHLSDFNELRLEMHRYTKKGRRELTLW